MKKRFSPFKFAILPIVLSCLHLTSGVAEALLIDFNSYTTGSNLDGQPATGTKWSGGGTDFRVVSGAGVGGSAAVVTGSHSGTTTTSSAFTPSGTDLPGFNGTTSIIDVSFSFRFVDLPNSSSDTVAAIQFGFDGTDATTAVRFYLRADGRIGYGSGTLVSTASFKAVDTTTWNTIDARLNYSTQTFSFSINGTPYATAASTTVFSFRGASHASTIRLNDSGSANFRSVAFDNISMVVIPEPSSAALLLLPAVAGAVLIHKRSKR